MKDLNKIRPISSDIVFEAIKKISYGAEYNTYDPNVRSYLGAARAAFRQYGMSGLYIQVRLLLEKKYLWGSEQSHKIKKILIHFCEQEQALQRADEFADIPKFKGE